MKPRTVVITGGTKGLGRETALAFGRAGYFVVAVYSSDEVAARELEAAFAGAGMAGCVVRHDITSADETAVWNLPAIQDAESLVLVHNACAPFSPKPMHQLGWQDYETNLNVAVKGAWQYAQGLIRPMLKNGRGTIVNILTSAIEGSHPKGFGAYLTAKHALLGFTLSLAAEYSPRGVRVFSASPGYMDTPLTRQWDTRLRDQIQSAGTRVTKPAEAAARLLELVQDATLPACGENYPI